jgi:hypothetical protein
MSERDAEAKRQEQLQREREITEEVQRRVQQKHQEENNRMQEDARRREELDNMIRAYERHMNETQIEMQRAWKEEVRRERIRNEEQNRRPEVAYEVPTHTALLAGCHCREPRWRGCRCGEACPTWSTQGRCNCPQPGAGRTAVITHTWD